MGNHDSSSENSIKFKDFSHLPGLTPEGTNKDSGFKIGQQNASESIRKLTNFSEPFCQMLTRLLYPLLVDRSWALSKKSDFLMFSLSISCVYTISWDVKAIYLTFFYLFEHQTLQSKVNLWLGF